MPSADPSPTLSYLPPVGSPPSRRANMSSIEPQLDNPIIIIPNNTEDIQPSYPTNNDTATLSSLGRPELPPGSRQATIDKEYDARRAKAVAKHYARCERIEHKFANASDMDRKQRQDMVDEKHRKELDKIDIKHEVALAKSKKESKRSKIDRKMDEAGERATISSSKQGLTGSAYPVPSTPLANGSALGLGGDGSTAAGAGASVGDEAEGERSND